VFVSSGPLVPKVGRPAQPSATAEERVCARHGLTRFHRYSAGRGRFRWRCKRCVGEAVTRRHQEIKRVLVGEAGGRCAVCGYDRAIVCLHFHHVDPATKTFGVNCGHGKSLASYRAEARKCVLVCANCHGEIESGLIPSPRPQARFGDTPKENRTPTSSVKGSRPSR
jgi:hypothetical protein